MDGFLLEGAGRVLVGLRRDGRRPLQTSGDLDLQFSTLLSSGRPPDSRASDSSSVYGIHQSLMEPFQMESPKSAKLNSSYEDGSLWGDSDDDIAGVSELDREWKSRRDQFYNHGYREGISAAKNDSAQEGFNDGFKDSVLFGYNWGLVRGVTSAMAYLPKETRSKMIHSEEKLTEFKSLHESVHSISTNAALKLFYDDINKKKAPSDEQPGDPVSDSNVLGDQFRQLQLLLQQSPEVGINLEMKETKAQKASDA